MVGTDGELHEPATPAQFLADGYDPALVVTVTSLNGLLVGATAGSEGQAGNARFPPAPDGAIVVSSGRLLRTSPAGGPSVSRAWRRSGPGKEDGQGEECCLGT